MQKPTLLCIGMDPAAVTRLSFPAMGMGVALQTVPREKWGQTLGALCGLDAPKPSCPPEHVGEGMLVMAFFGGALMDRWLKEMRACGVSAPLKAVLTPHNRFWTCGRLYLELSREAAYFRARDRAAEDARP